MTGPRIIVCGGRDYKDRDHVCRTLSEIGPSYIAEGGARGADKFAHEWALSNKIPHEKFEAQWSIGKCAGPKRNQRMLDEAMPDLVVAFPGGDGTADMVRRARQKGVKVLLK